MKTISLLRLFVVISAFAFAFSGCKYEDGPALSLRQKKDRLTNLWKFSKVTLDGQDITDQYNRASFIISFDVVKAGNYTFTYRDTDGKLLSRVGGDNSPHTQAEREVSANRPPFMSAVGNNGSWTFVDKHNAIQMSYELSQDPENTTVPVYEIKELRHKKLKLAGTDEATDKELILEFEPLD